MTKSPRLYLVILALWSVLLALLLEAAFTQIGAAARAGWPIVTLVVASTVFIAYFWLNGMKDVVYTLYYHLISSRRAPEVPRRAATAEPRVVLVYCTCNDFSADSLLRSMRQEYGDYDVVILDDSSDPRYLAQVDAFGVEHGVRVVRRPDRAGFKAGNLNNYLGTAEFDYFVILDSDEIIPPTYISRCLDYFARYPDAGIVQANHVATRNRNAFMRMFSIGVDSHWIAYQTVKDRHGFLSLLGHGAMVSRGCYDAAGGFPHVVAEDLCFSIAARDAGYYTVFAPDVVCEEEYPVDYLAFKKRHSKWTQGNMEFIKRYTRVIMRSRMTWFEKLDIVLFTYNLPLTAVFSVYVAIHVVVLPMLGYRIEYPLWMLAPTAVFLLAPMLNDVIFHYRSMSRRRLAWYLLHTILLYGSMLLISFRASVSSAFGKSVFVVTPKEDRRITLREALVANRAEIIFGVLLTAVSISLTGSALPVLLIALPAVLCFYLALKHNQAEPLSAAPAEPRTAPALR
ncbi:glycosyltransferase family 2 protein [Actinoplanes sp. NPDC049118]|uniref:glycosyltransferase n=1 Tax=Actinoplanes sp. NPDC049118 TaxID=3155769 RepID=UPI003404221B